LAVTPPVYSYSVAPNELRTQSERASWYWKIVSIIRK
jgi:hypothetical protein